MFSFLWYACFSHYNRLILLLHPFWYFFQKCMFFRLCLFFFNFAQFCLLCFYKSLNSNCATLTPKKPNHCKGVFGRVCPCGVCLVGVPNLPKRRVPVLRSYRTCRSRAPVSSSYQATPKCSVRYGDHIEPIRLGKYPRYTAWYPSRSVGYGSGIVFVPNLPNCRVPGGGVPIYVWP